LKAQDCGVFVGNLSEIARAAAEMKKSLQEKWKTI